jgi:TrmH family RNA methyltransferase
MGATPAQKPRPAANGDATRRSRNRFVDTVLGGGFADCPVNIEKPTMISKADLRFIRSLTQKKHRQEAGVFVAEGTKLVEDLLRSRLQLKTIFAVPQWLAENAPKLLAPIETRIVTEAEMDRISELKSPSPVLALVRLPSPTLDLDRLESPLVLGLDDIQDAGNLGTILRLCDWFGIEDVLATFHTADCWSAKVVRAAMGSIARVHVHYCNDLSAIVRDLKQRGKPIYAASLHGDNLYQTPLDRNALLLLGNEGHGLSDQLARLCTRHLRIPNFSAHAHKAESLNVATAASIFCSEFKRT